MRRWRPPLNLRALRGPIAALLSLAGAIVLAIQLLQTIDQASDAAPLNVTIFALALASLLLFSLAAVLSLKAAQRLTLRFVVDRDAVTARWWGGRCVIPLNALTRDAAEDERLPERRFGSGSRNQIVVLQTTSARYALALGDPESFMREVAARLALGVVRPQTEGLSFDHWRLRAFVVDPVVRRTLLLALAGNAALWGLLSWRFQSLPRTIVTHFDPLGGPAGVRARSYTLTLLAVSSGLALLDGVIAAWLHQRSRVAAQALLLAALLVQCLMAVGLILLLFPQR